MASAYDHKKIEKKWQKEWEKKKIYRSIDPTPTKVGVRHKVGPKYYILDMFPYPSGEGLHVGHPKGYIATDVISRMKRMQGYNVLHPMGFDAFGLPAENYAIKTKTNPKIAVAKNVARYKEQLKLIGLDYDWSREVNTTDPKFYKWTQWIFLKLLEKGLAYESNEPVNWCPVDKTVLANEDVEGGKCERCGAVVEKKPMRQWVLKITDYADRMLEDLKLVEWPESIKEMQKNWIGRSEGVNIKCQVKGADIIYEAYDSVPQTYMAQTFAVIAPDHPLLPKLVKDLPDEKKILLYAKKMLSERAKLGVEYVKKIDGIFTGRYAMYEPAKRELPIWVASYAIMDYGSGIVNCSAHDERDWAFAKKFNIPLHPVVERLDIGERESVIKPELPMVERSAISAIVKHWSEEKYLCLKWKAVLWTTFITGGIEPGQTALDAARAEIKEETGYLNLKLIRTLPNTHSKFYHGQKKENRFAHFSNFYFQLENDEHVEQDEVEGKMKHDALWLTAEEIQKQLTPAGQLRDFEILQGKEKPIIKNGILTEPKEFAGREWGEVREDIINFMVKKGWVERKVNYKLRDWVFSRQRYWVEPIPVLHHNGKVISIPEKDLPVILPAVKSYEPTGTGESPLAAISKWINVKIKGKTYRRESNTMPQWAGSSWYYLRYMDPNNKKALVDKDKQKYWNSVDLYVGGAEHATRHLIYARFWHKFLYDIGVVSYPEPFHRLQSVGLIGGADGRKMSKRFGNVINPDDIVKTYGADTLRLYEMFMGPFDQAIAWSEEAIIGPRRFLERVWKIGIRLTDLTPSPSPWQGEGGRRPGEVNLRKFLNKTIKKVSEDIEEMRFNTAISSLMIFVNEVEKNNFQLSIFNFKTLLKLLAPFAPHITEELWHNLGEKKTIHLSEWPKWDSTMIVDDEVKIAVQVNGRVRAEIMIGVNEPEEEIKNKALKNPAVFKYLSGEPKKVIYVKNRLINIVI